MVEITAVALRWRAGCNIIVGQSHFIKTVEDIAEIIQTSVPGMKYGLAFSEASGPCLVRTQGNDAELVKNATDAALAVGAGHTFYLVIDNGFPINVLNQIKACQEVACIYAATANPLQVLVARTPQGGGIVGVVDGSPPKGVETEDDRADRAAMLRKFGYKF